MKTVRLIALFLFLAVGLSAQIAPWINAPAPTDSTSKIVAILTSISTLIAAVAAFLRDRSAKNATVMLDTVIKGTEAAHELYGDNATVKQVKSQIETESIKAENDGATDLKAKLEAKVQAVVATPITQPS